MVFDFHAVNFHSRHSIFTQPIPFPVWVYAFLPSPNPLNISRGMGKTMVEFFSALMVLRVCRYLSWRAAGDSFMTSAASLRALEACCSPSAAMTLALASRVDSASAAIDLCIATGRRTSLISTLST